MKLYLLLVIFILVFKISNQMKFQFDLGSSLYCFGEHILESRNFEINLLSKSNEFKTIIYDPNGNQMYSKEKLYEVKLNLIPKVTGIYQICFENNSSNNVNIGFEILTGVAAKDYSSLVTVGKIKPLELSLIKLLDSVENILKDYGITFSNEISLKKEIQEKISFNIFYCSAFVFFLIICVNVFEFLIIKRFIDNRKTI